MDFKIIGEIRATETIARNWQAQDEDQAFDRVTMSDKSRRFAVCVRNEGYEESLELRKLYEVLDDPIADKHDMVRVIDEEGEDYLYPEGWFLAIELPQSIEDAIVELAHT